MGLFENPPTPLTLEEVRLRLIRATDGATIRVVSKTGKVYTARHKPWWMMLGPGPEGQTCRACRFLRARSLANTYFKCGQQVQSAGAGTDIRKKDLACRLFKPLPITKEKTNVRYAR